MLRRYHSSQTLSCIRCHSPTLLRVHCKEATVYVPMPFMIQALFLCKRLCCTFIFPGEPGFLLLPRFRLVQTSPYHSRWLPLLSAQNLPKTQAAKVRRGNFFPPAQHGKRCVYTGNKVVPCPVMSAHFRKACQPTRHDITRIYNGNNGVPCWPSFFASENTV